MTPEERIREHRLEDRAELRHDVGKITVGLVLLLLAIIVTLNIIL